MAPSEQSWVPPNRPAGIPTTTPDVPPATSTPARRYGKIQDEGAIRQRWLEDPTDPTCQIQPSTLTADDLLIARWRIHTSYNNIPFQVAENAFALGYANRAVYKQTLTQNHAGGELGLAGCENMYDILVGKGLIIAEAMFRSDGPQFSQIARAYMQEVAEPQSLRHFYVCDIVNIDTKRFVEKVLYSSRNDLAWPPVCTAPLIWEYNTPEYQGLLGTRVGKCAVYLVLEIFPRGLILNLFLHLWVLLVDYIPPFVFSLFIKSCKQCTCFNGLHLYRKIVKSNCFLRTIDLAKYVGVILDVAYDLTSATLGTSVAAPHR